MMKRFFAGLLSLITIGAMLLSGIPAATYAVIEMATPTVDKITIVSEDASKRGTYEKHFLMSDGSYCVTIEPIRVMARRTLIRCFITQIICTMQTRTLILHTPNRNITKSTIRPMVKELLL